MCTFTVAYIIYNILIMATENIDCIATSDTII